MTWLQRSKLASELFRSIDLRGFKQLSKSPCNMGFSRYCSSSGLVDQGTPNKVVLSRGNNKRRFKVAAYCGVAAAIAICVYNTELTPYKWRPQLVLVPRWLEKKLGDNKIRDIKEEFKEDILPFDHPHTVRVRSITKNLIEAAFREPYDAWVCEPPSIAEQFPNYLNWEVIVIDRPIAKVCCYGAKIVIFTGLLARLESDAEIATIIGHEVGHDIARHAAEKLTKQPWLTFRQMFLLIFFDWEMELCFRKIEREADFIGMLVMASAGYDPRVAPTVYYKLSNSTVLSEYCSNCPVARKRACLLSRPEMMAHALFAYKIWKVGGIQEYLNTKEE